jgi:hypothetical protein
MSTKLNYVRTSSMRSKLNVYIEARYKLKSLPDSEISSHITLKNGVRPQGRNSIDEIISGADLINLGYVTATAPGNALECMYKSILAIVNFGVTLRKIKEADLVAEPKIKGVIYKFKLRDIKEEQFVSISLKGGTYILNIYKYYKLKLKGTDIKSATKEGIGILNKLGIELINLDTNTVSITNGGKTYDKKIGK